MMETARLQKLEEINVAIEKCEIAVGKGLEGIDIMKTLHTKLDPIRKSIEMCHSKIKSHIEFHASVKAIVSGDPIGKCSMDLKSLEDKLQEFVAEYRYLSAHLTDCLRDLSKLKNELEDKRTHVSKATTEKALKQINFVPPDHLLDLESKHLARLSWLNGRWVQLDLRQKLDNCDEQIRDVIEKEVARSGKAGLI